MDAARVLREARRRAGLTQAELAERVGMLQPSVARLETGRRTPSVDTLERLLRACGMTLSAEPRLAAGVDRERIRDFLRRERLGRLVGETVPGLKPVRALRVLSARHVRFVVVGATAARMHGAPVRLSSLDILPQPDRANRLRLRKAQDRFRSWRFGVGKVVVRRSLGRIGSYELLERAASTVPLERHRIRLASIDDLIVLAASRAERALLCAVREELDSHP